MTTTATTFFAYIHCKPDGTPFYVGKGVRGRNKNFRDRNPYNKKIVAKYVADNILIGTIPTSTNDIALELEIGLIKCLKRKGALLANITNGGEGSLGRPCSELTKQKVAEANKCRAWGEVERLKQSIAMTGVSKPNQKKTMVAKGHWKGVDNPWFGTGSRQTGAKNHRARKVYGVLGSEERTWNTLAEAGKGIGVSTQAVYQAIRKGFKSKGWILGYVK
jgi:hypothetical protein